MIEFFLDFDHNAVFQSKRIRLDEQPFVFLHGGGKVPPCFERIQPVLACAIFLLDIVDRDGCVRVDFIGVKFAGIDPVISIIIILRWNIQRLERLQILFERGIQQRNMLGRDGIPVTLCRTAFRRVLTSVICEVWSE